MNHQLDSLSSGPGSTAGHVGQCPLLTPTSGLAYSQDAITKGAGAGVAASVRDPSTRMTKGT